MRKQIAADDRLVPLEPGLFAILAMTDWPGMEARRSRLHVECHQWAKQIFGGAQAPEITLVCASCPEDGAFALPVLQQLRTNLAAAKDAARISRSKELLHG